MRAAESENWTEVLNLVSRDPDLVRYKDSEDGMNILHLSALHYCPPALFQQLLEISEKFTASNGNHLWNETDNYGQTLLQILAWKDSQGSKTKTLLAKENLQVNTRSKGGWSAVFMAVRNGNVSAFKALASDARCDLDIVIDEGSLLEFSVSCGRAEMLLCILNETKCRKNLDGALERAAYKELRDPLGRAVSPESRDLCRLLLLAGNLGQQQGR